MGVEGTLDVGRSGMVENLRIRGTYDRAGTSQSGDSSRG